eukprot:428496_1
MSQNEFLNALSRKQCLNVEPSKPRRSKRLTSKIQAPKNKVVWKCKCCGQTDIDDFLSTCIRCNSLKTDSESNPDANNVCIVNGYCRAVTTVAEVISQLIQNYLTLQKSKFKITWNRSEINSILDNYILNSLDYMSGNNTKCYSKYPKKAQILQNQSRKFTVVSQADLIKMFHLMRSKRHGNVDKELNKYEYWYTESKPPTISSIIHKATKSKAQQYQLKSMNLLKKVSSLQKKLSHLNKSFNDKCRELKQSQLYVVELRVKLKQMNKIAEQKHEQQNQYHQERYHKLKQQLQTEKKVVHTLESQLKQKHEIKIKSLMDKNFQKTQEYKHIAKIVLNSSQSKDGTQFNIDVGSK